MARPENSTRPFCMTLAQMSAFLVVGVLLVALAAPTLRGFREKQSRAQCLSNLKELGLAMAAYGHSYQGRCPMDGPQPTLAGSFQLFSKPYCGGGNWAISNAFPVMWCPTDRRPGATRYNGVGVLAASNISYSYVPGLVWQDVTPDSPLILDRIYATRKGDRWPRNGNYRAAGGNVLYLDGHADWQVSLPSDLKDRLGHAIVLSP